MTAATSTPIDARPERAWAGTGLGVALALVADALVLLVGNAGAPVQVVTGWAPDGTNLTVAEVAVTATVAVGAGGALLAAVERRRGRPWLGPWTALAGVVAVVSALPLWRLDVDAGSKVALSAMHLLTGAAAVAGHHFARRRRPSMGAA